MVHSSDRICMQENDGTDVVCLECVIEEYPCYTAQPMDESSFLLVDKAQEARDKIAPFVMFIK